jgi:5-methylcytosine-specific restriction protein A
MSVYNNPWDHLYWTSRWKHKTSGLRIRCLEKAAFTCADPFGIGGRHDLASHADHIVDHLGDLKLFYDPNNLQALCPSCHSKKTMATRSSHPSKPIQPPHVDRNGIIGDN